jgi:hypothetical protein
LAKIFPEYFHGLDMARHENSNPPLASGRICFGTPGRDKDGRIGLLDRSRDNSQVGYLKMLPLVAEGLAGPGTDQDIEGLSKSCSTLCRWDMKAFVDAGKRVTPPNAKIQAAMAEDIQHRPFLGKSDRVVEGEQIDGDAKPQALGALCRGGSCQEGGGEDREAAVEVEFRHPHGMIAQRLRLHDLFKELVI